MAGLYLHCQVESGTLLPVDDDAAPHPGAAARAGAVAAAARQALSDDHDARDLPIAQKRSICIGMGMTEKQGGSDVRANTTTATPVGDGGRGAEYTIRGHKWFFSAPMCDAHLVVARRRKAARRASSFRAGATTAARIRVHDPAAEGQARQPQQLEQRSRVPRCAPASCSARKAAASRPSSRWRPTRGCLRDRAAPRFIRQALVQALAYTRQRMRVRPAAGRAAADARGAGRPGARERSRAGAHDAAGHRVRARRDAPGDPAERVWKRVLHAGGQVLGLQARGRSCPAKRWRSSAATAMSTTASMARLFREAPVNSIWEGSGNVMCLDMLRAMRARAGGDVRTARPARRMLRRTSRRCSGKLAELRDAAALTRPTRSKRTGRLLRAAAGAAGAGESAARVGARVRRRRLHRDPPGPTGCRPRDGRGRWKAHRHRCAAVSRVSLLRRFGSCFGA